MDEHIVNQRYDLFLWRCGALLALMTLAGYLFLGPSEDSSVFGRWFSFDYNQNILHFVLALVALGAAWKGSQTVQKVVAATFGGLFVILAGLAIYRSDIFSPNLLMIHISSPWEALFYLFAGLWALWVVLMPAGPVFVKDDQ